MKFAWSCSECSAHGSVENPGLPVTTLINQCSFQHVETNPSCSLAKSASVELYPGHAVFVKIIVKGKAEADEARA